ncbi:hypothetical protein EW146_g6306 [Bondarzewia mesenterica]|uniref:HD domain-containing protein n=1 Tax=Bondarzewia mesenterica TaxID=1095465 RepID=A0A4V3XEL1_9AGAM|nr:hypothetical protein EW146_g6306 [Bondarzewia mesenterica]
MAISIALYPSPDEAAVIRAAEKLMEETMNSPPSCTTCWTKKYVPPDISSDPYAYFLPFFQSLLPLAPSINLVADGRAKTIARIVENVSWTTEKKLRKEGAWGAWHESCLELHCVQDADRLDAIGAFGIMRCSAFSSATNRVLHAPEGDPIHSETAIQHFHDKLLHIHERMKTEPGKILAEKRHQLMLNFLKAVDEEYNDES